MNSRTLSSLAVAGFVLLGLVSMGIRYYQIQRAQQAREESLWRLSYEVNFEANQVQPDQPPPEIRLALPFDTRHCEVIKEEWFNSPLREQVRYGSITRTRELILTVRQPRQYDVRADFELRLNPRANTRRQLPLESLSGDARVRFTRSEDTIIPVSDENVRKVLQLVPEEVVTDMQMLQWIFEYCRDIDSQPEGARDSAADALATGIGTPLARARAMVALCRAVPIPARLVAGFEIRQQTNAQPRVWVEAFHGQSWVPFDPEAGHSLQLPLTYVPVRRGGDMVVRGTNIVLGVVNYSIMRLRPDARVLTAEVKHLIHVLDLKRLPVPMHQIMALLLLLPFGALITAVMRNVVGIRTFGTFSPALLAMSFIYADWQTGLAILIVVITAGVIGRTLLERLRLLMVPRLSIILTMVILSVVLCVSMLNYLDLAPRAQAVLLPMVILTMLIERFHVTAEEDGMMFTLQLAVGTIVVAALCYAVLRWDEVGHFVLTYPESHFFTIAFFILLGRYAGYRLTELWRFRDLIPSSEAPR